MKTVKEIMDDEKRIRIALEGIDAQIEDQHFLETISDEYAQEVYLILLFSVVENINHFKDESANPFLYFCKITTKFSHIVDMNDILKKCVTIDEDKLLEYAKVLRQKDLLILFLYDASMQIYLLKLPTPKTPYKCRHNKGQNT